MSASGLSRRPMRWIAVFALLLFVSTAIPVFAASPSEPSSGESQEAEESSVPLPKGEDVSEGLAEAEQQEKAHEEEVATPGATQEREASASAYTSTDASESERLLKEQFSEELAALNADPARFLSDATLDQPLGESGAKVTDEEGKTQLLESGVPVQTENEEGELRKVDLTLQSNGEGFVPANPLVELDIARAAAEGVKIGDSGLAITETGASEAGEGRLFGDKNIFYPEVATDTDLLASPVSGGVELFDQLRSADSPEALRFQLDLPEGAELRSDGHGGAEVIKEDSTLALIPLPSAVDAQGTQVPVELEVEGDAVIVRVARAEAQFAYPILVDPAVTDTFSWSSGYDLEALESWRGIWKWESNDESQFKHSTECIFSCFTGTARGLYASSISASFPANAYGQWYYVAPGNTTYIPSIYPTPSATINPFNRDNHGCSWEKYRQPHDYDGLWTGSSWAWLETDRAQWYGNDTIFSKGKVLVLGLSTGGSSISIPCWRDVRGGGVSVWLEDPEAPHLNSVEGVPTGWLKKDSTPHTISVSATDEGLGVQYVRMYGIGSSEWRWNQPWCTGLWASRCSETRSGQTTFETGGFPYEGKVPFSVQAIDPTGKGYNPKEYSLLVDGTSPTINLTGQLATATSEQGAEEKPQSEGNDELNLPTYKLAVEAKDGSASELRSGVKEIKLYLDGSGTPLASQSQSCPAGSCAMTMNYTLKLPGLSEGKHTLKVVAVDQAGNETKPERKIEFEYIPATGMKEEYVLQHFQLPDGHDYSEERQFHGPELAVNVTNGNVVYHERDMDVTTSRADLELERIYNSQLPAEKDAQWGHGWSLAQTPEFKPEAGPTPKKATMVRTSAITNAVAVPESEAQQTFSQKLHATISKATGGRYEVAYETHDETAVFSSSGRIEEARLTNQPGSASAGGESAPAAPTYVSSFGSAGTGNGQFAHPAGIAVGPTGSLWVVDENHYRVQKFNEAGEYQSSFGSQGTENGKFGRPTDVAVSANGNLWVTDANNNRLEEFNEKGEFLAKVGTSGSGNLQFSGPESLAIDAKGDIWVGDTYNHRVQELNEKGEFIRAFGSYGKEPGQIIESTGIAVAPNGNVWVADWGNNRVEVYSETGTFIRQFGSTGSGNGQFKQPDVIDIDTKGDVWVGDQNNSRIQEFNQSGEFVTQFGSAGTGQGQFSFGWPMGIATDSKGRLWISDTGNNRVQRWQIPEYPSSPYNPASAVKYTYSGSTLSKMVLDEPAPLTDPSLAVNVENGLTSSISNETAGTTSFKYEANKLTSAKDSEGETKYTYDANGRLKKVELANGTWAEVTYDSTSRATAVTVDPAGPEEAKTTHFSYSEEPRQTTVWGGGRPEVIYSIGEDGSVFKRSYAEVPPAIDSISGSLWANRNSTTPVENKDQTLFVTGSSPHEIAKVQVVVNGESVLEEKICEDLSELPDHHCEHVTLEWVTNPAEHAAGQLNLEAVVTDFLGHQTAERFFVTIPQQPPPDPEAPPKPTFEQIKKFREEFGLDRTHKYTEQEMTALILELLYEWELQKPNAVLAVEKWGVPLRSPEIEELEYRESYIEQFAEFIPEWVEEHAPTTYGGYYVDNRAGGLIYVGFTANQQSQVESLKQAPGLIAPTQIHEYSTPPATPIATVETTEESVAEYLEANPTINSQAIELGTNPGSATIRVGATNPNSVQEYLTAHFGSGANIEVFFKEETTMPAYSRYTTNGPINPGDALMSTPKPCKSGEKGCLEWKSCTAGFSGYDIIENREGHDVYADFALTAGHCFAYLELANRDQSPAESPEDVKKLGLVRRRAWGSPGDKRVTDAEAIRIDPDIRSGNVYVGDPHTLLPIHGLTRARIGSTLCWSGINGGANCGPIKRLHYVNYDGRWTRQVEVPGGVAEGDSGGPAWNARSLKAVGVITAESGPNCHILKSGSKWCWLAEITPLVPYGNRANPFGALNVLHLTLVRGDF